MKGRRMKRKLVLVPAVLALVGAGLAIAKATQTASVAPVSATFAATTATGRTATRTCTSTDGKTLVTAHASYSGSASSTSPELTGPVRIDATSLIDTSDDLGKVDAHLKITTSVGKTDLHFTGVYDHGNLAGFATGHAATPHVQLIGDLSSGFSTTGGFTNGRLGSGSAVGAAIELGPGRCAPNKPSRPKQAPKPKPTPPAKPHPQTASATGTIMGVSSNAITVAGLTCAIPANLVARVSAFKNGDDVRIHCTIANGATTLTKIDKKP